MKTLDEHNKEHENILKTSNVKAGVTCPKHPDVEMEFVNNNLINASWPPSQTVYCPVCDYIGYKRC